MRAETYTSVQNVTAAAARRPAAVLGSFIRGLGLRNAADAWLIVATFAFVVAVLVAPNLLTIGVGIWWLLNTVSHNFIHRPFFRFATANHLFAVCLSIATMVPHRLWRDRHLAHHADRPWRLRFSRELLCQCLLVAFLWLIASVNYPWFTLLSLAPGFLLAMGLCALHGHFEHVRGTTSHYGVLYNALFFNDGYHVEHHEAPGLHWTDLPSARRTAQASRWPAVLRWLDLLSLTGLELCVLRFPCLQRWVVAVHVRAIRKVMTGFPAPNRVAIVGGGIFPRTALVVRTLWPTADVTIIDANREHLEKCRPWLHGDEHLICAHVSPDSFPEADLVFVPLAFDQDKSDVYSQRLSARVIVHDWFWNCHPRVARSAIASILLLKRINLLAS